MNDAKKKKLVKRKFNVDNYRMLHESSTEWNLRRAFLLAHHEKLDKARLACLSSCFINVHVYGCSYPPALMSELRCLEEDIGDCFKKFKDKVHSRITVKFVKSSDHVCKETETNKRPLSDLSDCDLKQPTNKQKRLNPMTFVKADSETNVESPTAENDATDDTMNLNTKTNAQPLIVTDEDCDTPPNDAAVTTHSESEQYLKDHRPQIKDGPSAIDQIRNNLDKFTTPLSRFILTEYYYAKKSHNPKGILKLSANFNNATVRYKRVKSKTPHMSRCTIRVLDTTIADITCESNLNVKLKAAEYALDFLRKKNWTINFKQAVDNAGHDSQTKADMIDHLIDDMSNKVKQGKDTPISDSNVGNKLLRLMGWTGGGIGAKGNIGIAEPVNVDATFNRAGLGLTAQPDEQLCPEKVKSVLKSYLTSEREDDLVFSPELNRDQRAMLHRESVKLGLRSRSYGKGDTRYLVVSRKRSPFDLLVHILKEGGETSKYLAIAPGKHPACLNSYATKSTDILINPINLTESKAVSEKLSKSTVNRVPKAKNRGTKQLANLERKSTALKPASCSNGNVKTAAATESASVRPTPDSVSQIKLSPKEAKLLEVGVVLKKLSRGNDHFKLQQACQKYHQKCSFNVCQLERDLFRCDVKILSILICQGQSKTKREATNAACTAAVKLLSSFCFKVNDLGRLEVTKKPINTAG